MKEEEKKIADDEQYRNFIVLYNSDKPNGRYTHTTKKKEKKRNLIAESLDTGS